MSATTRWLLVLPAAIATTVACFLLFTLGWNLTSTISIVPQSDLISLGLANFSINAFSAGLGVLAAASVAPSSRRRAAIGVAGLYLLLAAGLLIWGVSARDTLRMSLGWHIWGTVAWAVGTVAGVIAAKVENPR